MSGKKNFRVKLIQRVKAEMQRDSASIFVAHDIESELREELVSELKASDVRHIAITASDSVSAIANKIIESGSKTAVILDSIDQVSEDNVGEFLEFVAHRKLPAGAGCDVAAMSILMIDRSGDGYSFAILQRCTLLVSDGEITEIEHGSDGTADSETTISFIVGYIPADWQSATDGSNKIIVGDEDYSQTSELQYRITNEEWRNISSGKQLRGSLNNHYLEMTRDSRALSNNEREIPPDVFENIYQICLEDTESQDVSIVLVKEGMDQLVNTKKKYNGNFYGYYVEERDDGEGGEIAREILFVVKCL